MKLIGEVEWILTDKDTGEEVDRGIKRNVITDSGLQALLQSGGFRSLAQYSTCVGGYPLAQDRQTYYPPGDIIATKDTTGTIIANAWYDAVGLTPGYFEQHTQFSPPANTQTIYFIGMIAGTTYVVGGYPPGINGGASNPYSGGQQMIAYVSFTPPCTQTNSQYLTVYYRILFPATQNATTSGTISGLTSQQYRMFSKGVAGQLPQSNMLDRAAVLMLQAPSPAALAAQNLGGLPNSVASSIGYGNVFGASCGVGYSQGSKVTTSANFGLNDHVGELLGTLIGATNVNGVSGFMVPVSGVINKAVPIQNVHNHNAINTVPFLDVTNLATGTGSVTPSGTWTNPLLPELHYISVVSGGTASTATYTYKKRYTSGFIGNTYQDNPAAIPGLFVDNSPINTVTGQDLLYPIEKQFGQPINTMLSSAATTGSILNIGSITFTGAIPFDAQTILMPHADRVIKYAIPTGAFTLYNNDNYPSFTPTSISQICIDGSKNIYVACQATGLWQITPTNVITHITTGAPAAGCFGVAYSPTAGGVLAMFGTVGGGVGGLSLVVGTTITSTYTVGTTPGLTDNNWYTTSYLVADPNAAWVLIVRRWDAPVQQTTTGVWFNTSTLATANLNLPGETGYSNCRTNKSLIRVSPNTSFWVAQYGIATAAGAPVWYKLIPGQPSTVTKMDFGANDFTCEMWLYPSAYPAQQAVLLKSSYTGYSSFEMDLLPAGQIGVWASSTGSSWDVLNGATSTSTVPLNTWTHVAIVRSGTNVNIYINGVASGTFAVGTSTLYPTGANGGLPIVGGATTGYGYNGFMYDVRVVKGTAVYTAAFTPPSAPLTAIAGTTLLIDGTSVTTEQGTGYSLYATEVNSGVGGVTALPPFVSTTQHVSWATSSIEFTNASGYGGWGTSLLQLEAGSAFLVQGGTAVSQYAGCSPVFEYDIATSKDVLIIGGSYQNVGYGTRPSIATITDSNVISANQVGSYIAPYPANSGQSYGGGGYAYLTPQPINSNINGSGTNDMFAFVKMDKGAYVAINTTNNAGAGSHQIYAYYTPFVFDGTLSGGPLGSVYGFRDYSWNGSSWVEVAPGTQVAKTTTTTPSALPNGWSVTFASGAVEPSFVANEYYTFGTYEGILKDNATTLQMSQYTWFKKPIYLTALEANTIPTNTSAPGIINSIVHQSAGGGATVNGSNQIVLPYANGVFAETQQLFRGDFDITFSNFTTQQGDYAFGVGVGDYLRYGFLYTRGQWFALSNNNYEAGVSVPIFTGTPTSAEIIRTPSAVTLLMNGTTVATYSGNFENEVWAYIAKVQYYTVGVTTGTMTQLGTITGGSGYNNGTYYYVPLYSQTGTGSGATANIYINGNTIQTVTLGNFGSGYTVGDVLTAGYYTPGTTTLTASNALIGNAGSGFTVTVGSAFTTVPTSLIMPTATIVSATTSNCLRMGNAISANGAFDPLNAGTDPDAALLYQFTINGSPAAAVHSDSSYSLPGIGEVTVSSAGYLSFNSANAGQTVSASGMMYLQNFN